MLKTNPDEDLRPKEGLSGKDSVATMDVPVPVPVPRGVHSVTCSQVFIMWGSLGVFDVGLLFPFDAFVGDGLSAVTLRNLARAVPVPVQSTDVLQSGHLFVSQIGNDLQHATTISVHTEHLVVNEVGAVEMLHHVRASEEPADDPLRAERVLEKHSFHF